MAKPDVSPARNVADPSPGLEVKDYIESMLEELAALATRAGEFKAASALRMALLEIGRL